MPCESRANRQMSGHPARKGRIPQSESKADLAGKAAFILGCEVPTRKHGIKSIKQKPYQATSGATREISDKQADSDKEAHELARENWLREVQNVPLR